MSGIRRTVIAGSALAAVLASGASAVAATNAPAPLIGAGHGTWHTLPGNPDTGTQRALVGVGHFAFGAAKIRGGVTSPGFIANGDCSVSVRLVTANGSITVVGHSKRTSSSYPTCIGPFGFAFHTTKATGSLAGDSFKGVGHLNLQDQSTSITGKGTFTLKLSSPGFAGPDVVAAAPAQLTGSGHGTWQQKPTNPDVGTQRIVRGHGHFAIGDATIRGMVSAPGFVIEGSCGVSAVLATSTGSITIVGHSKVESRSGGSICDGHKFRFHFHTTKATGDLSGDSFTGVGRFVLTDASNAAYNHGTFTLTLGAVS